MNDQSRYYFKLPIKCAIYVDDRPFGKIGPSEERYTSTLLPLGRHRVEFVPVDHHKQSVTLSLLVDEDPGKNKTSIAYYRFIPEDADDPKARQLHDAIKKCRNHPTLDHLAWKAWNHRQYAAAIHAWEICAHNGAWWWASNIIKVLSTGPDCVRNQRLADYWYAKEHKMEYVNPDDALPVKVKILFEERCRVMLDGKRLGVFDAGEKYALYTSEGPHELTLIQDDDDSRRYIIRQDFTLDEHYTFTASQHTLTTAYQITEQDDSHLAIQFGDGSTMRFDILPDCQLCITDYTLQGRYAYFPEQVVVDGITYTVTSMDVCFQSSGEVSCVVLPYTLRKLPDTLPAFHRMPNLWYLDTGDAIEGELNVAPIHIQELRIGPKVDNLGHFGTLTRITIHPDNPYFRVQDGVVYSHDMTKLITCTRFVSHVTIPSSVLLILPGAFYDCRSLTHIHIPDSVISIGANAFRFCTALQHVTIGAGVWNIGNGAFSDCYSLQQIELSGDNPALCLQDKIIYDRAISTVLIGNVAQPHVVLPKSVRHIADGAFFGSHIKSIQLPSGLKSIGNEAFAECDIDTITLPQGLESIGDGAFSNSALTSINLPKGLKRIGNNAFGDSCLLSIEIPEGVEIGNSAFSGCRLLERVVLLGSIKSNVFGADTFVYCTELREVVLGNAIESLDLDIFNYCHKLTTLEIPSSVKEVSSYGPLDEEYLEEDEDPDSRFLIGIRKLILHSHDTTLSLNGYADRINIEYI